MNRLAVDKVRCGIVGAGNSAHALACYLKGIGHDVHIYARSLDKVPHLRTGSIRAQGKLEGIFPLAGVTPDPKELAERCQTIFVCTTTDQYSDVFQAMGPFLSSGQEVILFSSKLGGSQLVEHQLLAMGRRGVKVIETDALFACRLQDDGSIWIRGVKDWTLYSCPKRSQTESYGQVVTKFFPNLEPADNLVQRGLTDFGALAHALTVLVNLNSIDRKDSFLFYYDGFTPKTIALLEEMESEFKAVAVAYGTRLLSASELLNRYYGCETGSLIEAMKTVPNYRFSLSPDSLHTRYLHEDVACTLVPLSQLAELAGIRVPVVLSVIAMASVIAGVEFLREGRTLERLGWEHFGASEIKQWISC